MISKKVSIISLCATLMVAVVVAATVILVQKNDKDSSKPNNNGINASQKAVEDLCRETYYHETCISSLSNATKSSDIKELIKAGFQVAIQELINGINESEFLRKTSKDPNTAEAYRTCQKLLDDSIVDLRRTFDRMDLLQSNFKKFLDDMKTWLTGALTFQETCLDCFEDDEGDDGAKMRQLLKVSRELTINGLALMDAFTKWFVSDEHNTGRRLLVKTVKPDYNEYNIDQGLGWLQPPEKTRRLLYSTPENIEPHVVVAKDGTGKYNTINEALKDVPSKSNDTFVIYIKQGVYDEQVTVYHNMSSVMFIGDGPTKTKITGNKSKVGGTETYWTATVAIEGDNFIAKDIGFENSAGPQMNQALALRVTGDYSIFYNCRMDGYQDTLCAHNHRQFYRDCTITGTIDFIFGNARAVFQNCTLVVKMPLESQECVVTAQGRTLINETSGFVLQNCQIIPAPEYPISNKAYKTFLGRPWKEYSKTIIMDSKLESVIHPDGWSPWNRTSAHLNTCWYAEINNKGPGADLSRRVTWSGIKKISIEEGEKYTPGEYLLADDWIAGKGIPFDYGRMNTIDEHPFPLIF